MLKHWKQVNEHDSHSAACLFHVSISSVRQKDVGVFHSSAELVGKEAPEMGPERTGGASGPCRSSDFMTCEVRHWSVVTEGVRLLSHGGRNQAGCLAQERDDHEAEAQAEDVLKDHAQLSSTCFEPSLST